MVSRDNVHIFFKKSPCITNHVTCRRRIYLSNMHMNSVRFLLNIGLEKALLLFFGFGLKTKKDKNNSLVDA